MRDQFARRTEEVRREMLSLIELRQRLYLLYLYLTIVDSQ